MKKKIITIIAVALVAAISAVALVACVPKQNKHDKAFQEYQGDKYVVEEISIPKTTLSLGTVPISILSIDVELVISADLRIERYFDYENNEINMRIQINKITLEGITDLIKTIGGIITLPEILANIPSEIAGEIYVTYDLDSDSISIPEMFLFTNASLDEDKYMISDDFRNTVRSLNIPLDTITGVVEGALGGEENKKAVEMAQNLGNAIKNYFAGSNIFYDLNRVGANKTNAEFKAYEDGRISSILDTLTSILKVAYDDEEVIKFILGYLSPGSAIDPNFDLKKVIGDVIGDANADVVKFLKEKLDLGAVKATISYEGDYFSEIKTEQTVKLGLTGPVLTDIVNNVLKMDLGGELGVIGDIDSLIDKLGLDASMKAILKPAIEAILKNGLTVFNTSTKQPGILLSISGKHFYGDDATVIAPRGTNLRYKNGEFFPIAWPA